MGRDGFTDAIKELAIEKDAIILGEYGCILICETGRRE